MEMPPPATRAISVERATPSTTSNLRLAIGDLQNMENQGLRIFTQQPSFELHGLTFFFGVMSQNNKNAPKHAAQ